MFDKVKAWMKFTFFETDKIEIPVWKNGIAMGRRVAEGVQPVNVVKEIAKVPGLYYKFKTEEGFYSDTRHYVLVTNEVGKVVEMYLGLDESYADMDLGEFITRTIPQSNG